MDNFSQLLVANENDERNKPDDCGEKEYCSGEFCITRPGDECERGEDNYCDKCLTLLVQLPAVLQCFVDKVALLSTYYNEMNDHYRSATFMF